MMRQPTQQQIDKFPTVSNETVAATAHAMRNYVVFIGEKFPVMTEFVHVGLGAENHLDAIKAEINNAPIHHIKLDNRAMRPVKGL